MKKFPKKSLLVSRFHKAFVLSCIAVTVLGFTEYGLRWARYFIVLKPELQQKQMLESKKLLEEGSSDKLQDIAINLKL